MNHGYPARTRVPESLESVPGDAGKKQPTVVEPPDITFAQSLASDRGHPLSLGVSKPSPGLNPAPARQRIPLVWVHERSHRAGVVRTIKSAPDSVPVFDIIYIMRNQTAGTEGRTRSPKPRKRRDSLALRFREARLSCLMSQADAAKLLRVTQRTVHNWEAGRVRVPYAAYKLIRIMRGYELPGATWRGWWLIGDRLITPEGRELRASDGAWWSLLVAQSYQFRKLLAERRQAERAAAPCAAEAAGLPSTDERASFLPPACAPASQQAPSSNRGLKSLGWLQPDSNLVSFSYQGVTR